MNSSDDPIDIDRRMIEMVEDRPEQGIVIVFSEYPGDMFTRHPARELLNLEPDLDREIDNFIPGYGVVMDGSVLAYEDYRHTINEPVFIDHPRPKHELAPPPRTLGPVQHKHRAVPVRRNGLIFRR